MGGCAYFLAGVSPGELKGIELMDAAQLEGQVAGFVGRDISWRADYVEVDGCNVLVVTVEPPRWSDRVHPARKTYNPEGGGRSALQEGTVYVRHQASTERATAADMDMLSRRAARRRGDELVVDVRLAPETSLRSVDLSHQAIAAYVEQEKSRLLAPLSRAMQRTLGVSLLRSSMLMGGVVMSTAARRSIASRSARIWRSCARGCRRCCRPGLCCMRWRASSWRW
jgi:hypothetical protein